MGYILLVDDDSGVREVISFTLRSTGYDVVEAASGEEALRIITFAVPSLIITDLKMSRIDGMSLLRITRNLGLSIPSIVISAYGSNGQIQEAVELGVIHQLDKPYDRDELRKAVSTVLNPKEARDRFMAARSSTN